MASPNEAIKTQLRSYRKSVIKIFDTHFNVLSLSLKKSIDTFASKAFEAQLISEGAREEKSYSSIVHEFKVGLELCKSILEVETQCSSFIEILIGLGGPAGTVGRDLCEELEMLLGNQEIFPNGLSEVKTDIHKTASDDTQLIPRADTGSLTNLLRRIDEVRELKKIAELLRNRFHKLPYKVKNSLLSNGISLDEVTSFVDQELKVDIRIKGETGMDIYRHKLRKMKDMDSFFDYLKEHDFYGYLNYVPLKRIAKLAEDEKIRRKFKEYEELYVKLISKATFKNIMSIFHENPDLKSVAPIGLPNIVFHLDDFWFREYFHRWRTLFFGYSWYESCLLQELEENCIIVTYAILPSALNDALESLKSPAVQKKFHDLGVSIELPETEEGIKDDQSKDSSTMLPSRDQINQSKSPDQESDFDDSKSHRRSEQITSDMIKPNQPEPPADLSSENLLLSNVELSEYNSQSLIQESIHEESDIKDSKSCVSHISSLEQLIIPTEISDKDSGITYGSRRSKQPTEISDKDSGITYGSRRSKQPTEISDKDSGITYGSRRSKQPTKNDLLLMFPVELPGQDKVLQTSKLDHHREEPEQNEVPYSLPMSRPLSPITLFPSLLDMAAFAFPEDPVLDSIMNKLLEIKEKPSTLTLSVSDFKDVIVKKTVSCNLFLAAVGGLPNCGKSTLVHNFLKHSLSVSTDDISSPMLMNTYEKHRLSHYGISVLGGNADESLCWMPFTQRSMHTFTCSSAILHDSLLQGQQIELDQIAISGDVPKIFEDDTLNRHLHRIYCDIDRTLRRTDISPELKRVVSSGVVFGNIFDVGFSKGVYNFLSLVSRYTHRQLGFFVVSIDDIHNLKEMPNLSFPGYDSEKPLMERGSKISYMLQFAAATHLAVPKTPLQSPAVAFIISSNKSLSPKEKETAKETLCRELSSEAQHLGLPKPILDNILVLNFTDDSDSHELKLLFENMIKKRTLRKNIKLSWIFLRSLFYFTDRMFISKHELEAYALELDIEGSEYLEFLKTFTEFSSIFYIPNIPSLKNIIILQPVKFVNLLCHLFYPPKGSEEATFDGLFTEQQVIELLSKEASEVIVPTLCSLGLAAEVHSKKLQQVKKERRSRAYSTETLVDHFPASISDSWPPLLFVPSARRGNLRVQKTSFNSLFILYDYKFTPPDVQGLFTQRILTLPNVLFVSTSEVNVVKFVITSKGREYELQVIFHSTHLELIIEYNNRSELDSVCEKILQCCKRALDTICKMIKDLSYRFALVCLQPIKLQEGDHLKTKYEILPSKQLCHSCEATKSLLRKSWNENILEMYEKTLRQSDIITPDKLFDLAMELDNELQNHEEVKQLTAALGVDKEEEIRLALSHYSRWQRILIILLAWQKKVGPDQATKRKLSSILIHLRITTQSLS